MGLILALAALQSEASPMMQRIDSWVTQLGDADIEVRESAESGLERLLQAAIDSGILHSGLTRYRESSGSGRELDHTSKFSSLGTIDPDLVVQEDAENERKLRSIRISVEMKDAPLTAVVDHIREVTGMNFVIDTDSIEAPQLKWVTVKVRDVTAAAALDAILKPLGLAYAAWGGIVCISTPEKIRRTIHSVSVADLAVNTGGGEIFNGARPPFEARTFAAYVQEWLRSREDGSGTERAVTFRDGTLVVSGRTGDMHEVTRLMNDIRSMGRIGLVCRDRTGLAELVSACEQRGRSPVLVHLFRRMKAALSGAGPEQRGRLVRLLDRIGCRPAPTE